MNKTLVTGHNGMVGSAITELLNASIYPNRIDNLKDFSDYLLNNNVDTVIHTAAKVGGVRANFENKIDFYLLNSKISNIVFEACYENGIANLVNFSSTCVFPDSATYPLTEDQIFNGKPHYTNDGYAYAKRMMQFMCELGRKEGLNYFTIIPTNVFGPGDNYNLVQGHVLPALIHKCYAAKQKGTDFVIGGSGKPLREFIYSKDLARLTDELIEADFKGDSIIASTSEEISIADCAKLIAKYMEFEGNVTFDTTFLEGQHRKPTDTSLLKSLLPDFKFTPFEEALKDSVQWFIDNYQTARL
jgi:GDP-L-fucose synthase